MSYSPSAATPAIEPMVIPAIAPDESPDDSSVTGPVVTSVLSVAAVCAVDWIVAVGEDAPVVAVTGSLLAPPVGSSVEPLVSVAALAPLSVVAGGIVEVCPPCKTIVSVKTRQKMGERELLKCSTYDKALKVCFKLVEFYFVKSFQ